MNPEEVHGCLGKAITGIMIILLLVGVAAIVSIGIGIIALAEVLK